MAEDVVGLSEGSGGSEMAALIASLGISKRGKWRHYDDDAATLDIGGGKLLVFTTDSFIVDPIFFPGADIGHLAFCGTVNDLAVMGAQPLGLSLSLVLEEGLPKKDLKTVVDSIKRLSAETGVPVVTGDTKVMERGKLDKLVINTSGVGLIDRKELLDKTPVPGDQVIISGGLGEHAVALLSKRFDYETDILSDSKPLIEELKAVGKSIKCARDITRGGLAAVTNELCGQHKLGMLLQEQDIPVKKQVKAVTDMLGLNVYELACEGRFLCIADRGLACGVEQELKRFNADSAVVGAVTEGDKVVVQTELGKRILALPTGRIVPRIC
jgi:hydrogenase expression/formation protein HypE